jgi:sugar O-acyltransferase (sialic acid O-acetyltransferase NeuD family)
MKTLHIIGAGGFGKEVAHLVASKNEYTEILFHADDDIDQIGVLSIDSLIDSKETLYCVIAIGDNNLRELIFNRLQENSLLKFINLDFRDNSAYPNSPQNIIGSGNIIMPNSIIGVYSSIGSFNIIGSNAGFGHHVNLGDFNFIGPGSFLAGSVQIGSHCTLSFGTGIMPKVKIESNINTMPYTVIYKNIRKPGSYTGNPAKQFIF